VVRLRQPLAWAEARPLHGVRALATRAASEGGGFGRAVAELGGEPLFLPVTRRVAIDDDAARLRAALADLARFDWIAFASGHAVDRFFASLRRSGRDARALGRLRLACVGKATAAALARHGLTADVVSTGDAARMAADLAASGRPEGTRVLLPRAAGGRDEAMLLLRALGVAVEPVALYRSEPTPADDPQLGPGLGLLRRGQVHAVAVFAPSQARALIGLLGPDAPAILGRVATVAAIGETTRRALEAAGVRVDVVPPSAEAGALAAALAR
jgi:uroporphyrinogen III methyltransferase/synthase